MDFHVNAFVHGQTSATQAIVAIPAHNEADWIARCLTAISQQETEIFSRAIVLVNNSTDPTASIARDMQAALPFPLQVIEHQFSPEHRNAGQARRMAMEYAADWAPDHGVLLCSDADGQVAPDWLSANLYHIRNGADAVAGCAVIDPVDAAAIPAILHEDDARECAYAALLDEIDSLLDPDPADPWPRHNEHSGASICVTVDAFRRVGGIPAQPVGEDRAFFAALRRIDARIRHPRDVRVTVSGRIHGRATGGMADTIRRRLIAPDLYLDDALEPAMAHAERARLRRKIRDLFDKRVRVTARLSDDVGCPPMMLAAALHQKTFGMAWEMFEAHATGLDRAPVPVSALPHETAQALRILAALRHERSVRNEQTHRPELEFAQPQVSQWSGTSHMAG
jgi:glycosyltransferase involved in cell wall biosynthesis